MNYKIAPEIRTDYHEIHYDEDRAGGIVTAELFADLPTINSHLEHSTPKETLKWAWRTFGEDMIASSSFQTQSLPLLHMISQVVPDLKIVFVDTGFHFPETLAYRDALIDRLGLNVKIVGPQIKGDDFLAIYGPLYAQSPDACCFFNKVAPFQLELKNYSAWISGIRRDQTATRENAGLVEQHPFLPVYKISPMVNWTEDQIEDYINFYELPRHPLYEQGYRSVGCAPCTQPTFDTEDARQGRWRGLQKNECGMHINIKK